MKVNMRFFTAIVSFVAGIALIVLHNEVKIMEWIVMILGFALLIPAFINIIYSAFSKKAERVSEEDVALRRRYVWGLVVSSFFVAIGVAMVVANGFFATVIAYLFAAVLIAVGFYHVMVVSYLARPYIMPFYYYIIPALLISAGLVILFTGVRTMDNIVVLMLGIGLLGSSLNSLLEYIGTHPTKIEKE